MKITMKTNDNPGKLVAFCGVDGAGKSTLIAHAAEFLAARGVRFTVLKMPSDRIRKLDIFRDRHDSHDEGARKAVSDLALTVLVSGDRMISLEQDILPRLRAGEWVLCDRYVFSGLACADSAIIRGIANEFVRPDLAILANASAETVKARVKARPDEASNFYDERDTQKKLRKFLEISEELPFFQVINTEEAMEKNRQAVADALRKIAA